VVRKCKKIQKSYLLLDTCKCRDETIPVLLPPQRREGRRPSRQEGPGSTCLAQSRVPAIRFPRIRLPPQPAACHERASSQLPPSGCLGGGRAQERDVGRRHRPGHSLRGGRRRLSHVLASGTNLPGTASAAGILYSDASQHTGSGSVGVVQKSCSSKRGPPSCVPSHNSPE